METQKEINERLREMIETDKKLIEEGKLKHPPGYSAEDFTEDELKSAKNRDSLLFLNMEFFNGCNFGCPSCFNNFDTIDECRDYMGEEVRFKTDSEKPKLSHDEIKEVLDQAADLGTRTVSLIGGGEPLLYKGFFDLVKHVNSNKMNPWTFTNGSRITEEVARKLYENAVTTIVKLNSLDPEIHDKMVGGKKGAHKRVMKGLNYLLDVGYCQDEKHQLGLESVVVNTNYNDITYLWRYARNNGMIPYIERTVGCNLKLSKDEITSVRDLKKLWETLLKIDQEEYGYTWPLLPLIAGDHCASNDLGAYITTDGDVKPCGGTPIVLGNVREAPLASIIKESETLKSIREIRDTYDGFCKKCEYAIEYNCSGCRGYAFAVTDDVLADDPACFHNPANLE